ncbi:MAG: alpha/beta fold hydrolase [Gemmatimonas sp.]|nr:alpha/beta fold hydrolase [Gemmatimonas sp.]
MGYHLRAWIRRDLVFPRTAPGSHWLSRESVGSMARTLHHSMVAAEGGEPLHWLYLLHGIYGSGRNWASIARRLVEGRPEWQVVLVDLRLHGRSTGFEPPHTVERSAEDLTNLERSLDHPADAVLGHSFGGKVALLRAGSGPPLGQVWVADSTLRTGEPEGSAWELIDIVRGLPDRFLSRDEIADALLEHGYPRGVGQWLAMNLEREGDAFRWKLDWEGVEELLIDYFQTEIWGIVEQPPAETSIHIIKARASNAIDPATVERIERAGEQSHRVFLHTIDGGHWMNIDNPDAVVELLVEHL